MMLRQAFATSETAVGSHYLLFPIIWQLILWVVPLLLHPFDSDVSVFQTI